jgi:hypothetical protein
MRPSPFGPALPPNSTEPVPLVMNCAVPPLALSKKLVGRRHW